MKFRFFLINAVIAFSTMPGNSLFSWDRTLAISALMADAADFAAEKPMVFTAPKDRRVLTLAYADFTKFQTVVQKLTMESHIVLYHGGSSGDGTTGIAGSTAPTVMLENSQSMPSRL